MEATSYSINRPEKILGKRKSSIGQTEYLIRWKLNSEDFKSDVGGDNAFFQVSWEPKGHLVQCRDLYRTWEKNKIKEQKEKKKQRINLQKLLAKKEDKYMQNAHL